MRQKHWSPQKLFHALMIFSVMHSLPTFADPRPTLLETEMQILSHKTRVQAMGLQILSLFLEKFPRLREIPTERRHELVQFYLGLHDAPKTMDLKTLKRFSYSGSTTLLEEIHQNWEVHHDEKPVFVRELNRIESLYKIAMMSAFAKQSHFQLDEGLWRDLLRLEDVADIFDTKNYRLKELKIVFRYFATAEFFSEVRNDPELAKIAEEFEKIWYKERKLCELLMK